MCSSYDIFDFLCGSSSFFRYIQYQVAIRLTFLPLGEAADGSGGSASPTFPSGFC